MSKAAKNKQGPHPVVRTRFGKVCLQVMAANCICISSDNGADSELTLFDRRIRVSGHAIRENASDPWSFGPLSEKLDVDRSDTHYCYGRHGKMLRCISEELLRTVEKWAATNAQAFARSWMATVDQEVTAAKAEEAKAAAHLLKMQSRLREWRRIKRRLKRRKN